MTRELALPAVEFVHLILTGIIGLDYGTNDTGAAVQRETEALEKTPICILCSDNLKTGIAAFDTYF